MSLASFGPPEARKDTRQRAALWARAVVARYGWRCYLHALRDPRTQVRYHHAAHIIKRSKMGAAIAYGPKDGDVEPRLGRPLCYDCHRRQEDGLDPDYRFPLADRVEAVTLHNSWATSKLPVPTE